MRNKTKRDKNNDIKQSKTAKQDITNQRLKRGRQDTQDALLRANQTRIKRVNETRAEKR